MPKRLSERVIARLERHAKRSTCHNRVVFSSLQDEIKEALQEGCSLKSIWETLHEEGKVNFKYRAFLRYAGSYGEELKKNHIKAKPIRKNSVGTYEKKKQEILSKESAKSVQPETSTFSFNPKHNLEDFT